MKYIFDKEKLNKKESLIKSFLMILSDNENEKNIKKNIFVYTSINDFPMDYYFYDIDTNEIKQKTKYQLYKDNLYNLIDGEIIKENDIVEIERPTQYHVWNKDKFLWELNLDEIKEKKRDELKYNREEKIAENIEVHGSLFQVREKDLENFEDVARAIRRGKRQLTDRRIWVLADNSVKEFTYAQLLDVLDERAERKDKIFAQFAILSMQLEKCENVDDIEKIKWE